MPTASSVTWSVSAGRPRSEKVTARLASAWPGRAGTGPGSPAPVPGRCRCFLLGGQRLGWPAEVREGDPEVGEGGGQVGANRSGFVAASSRRMAAASCSAGSACAGRPSCVKRMPRLDSAVARSGRYLSGFTAASSRLMRAASCATGSASSGRPRSEKRAPRSDSERASRAGTGRGALRSAPGTGRPPAGWR